MLRNLSAGHKILLAFGAILGMAGAAAAVIVVAMLIVSRSGEMVGRQLAPLADAALQVQLYGTSAHLVMEEIMAGDAAEDFEEVLDYLAKARFYARAILDGADDGDVALVPSTDPDVRKEISEVLAGLAAFEQAARDRYLLLSRDTGAGSAADQQFDELFDRLILTMASVTEGSESPGVQRLGGEVRFLLAFGHLVVEEVIGGDAGEDFSEATSAFAEAAKRVSDMIRLAPELAGSLRPLIPEIERFSALGQERYARLADLAHLFERAETGFDAGFEAFFGNAGEAVRAIRLAVQAGQGEQAATSRRAMVMAAAIAVVTVSVLLILYRWLDRSLGRRMNVIADAMERMSAGELDVDIPDWGTRDEVGSLGRKLEDLRMAFIRQKALESEVVLEREEALRQRTQAEEMRKGAVEAQEASERGRKAAEMRSKAADTFGAEFSRVVDSARKGQFDARIEVVTGQRDLDALGEALNEMMSSIEGGIRATIAVMSAVSAGDLTSKMEGYFQGAFLELQGSINTTFDELTRITRSLASVSQELTGEASTLSRRSDELSRRSASQAASLEETNAAIARMSSMVKSTEGDCTAAVDRVREVSGMVKSGEDVVQRAIKAVEYIDENARKVGEFITVIDEISFQTNLLALNAGVEAARAGEAGKGFAVVAQEVRALAQRANEAASGIGVLIEESGRGVEEGVKLVTKSGAVLREILTSIAEVSESSVRIAMSSREQSSGISEVSAVVAELDRLTQQNAAMAEEGTQVSKKLQ